MSVKPSKLRNERLTMNNFEDLMNHEKALTVSCQECGAKVDEACTRVDIKGDRWPLKNFPAHLSRLKRVDRLERLHQLDTERSKTFQADRTPSGTVSIAPEGDQPVGIDTEGRGR